ncbi:XAC2610-related protein [Olivibacter sitiensis]|uniref:XAC2610-related protein n=1 Tax=Olivibacter sitiensis TaxID=376470 RepID=UPI00040B07F1|nr:hypothetical protein [Olivibacter sitiensis]
MKFFVFYIIALCTSGNLYAQLEFPIKIHDFSDKYYALIDLNKEQIPSSTPSVYEEEGSVPDYLIRIYDKSTNNIVLEAGTFDFPDYLINDKNEAIPNIHELPYGSQSVLIYADFNFDEEEDFALMNGYASCYGGPSFDIYLADGNGKFHFSESFSVLSNEYCGLFQVDYTTKTIHTMTKSGCCWHQFSEFKVVNNEPRVIKVVEEGASNREPYFVEVTNTEWENDKATVSEQLFLPYNDAMEVLFSFDLEKSKKKVLLFAESEVIYYALQRPDESIEFYYPQPFYDEEKQEMTYGKITYDRDLNTVTFTNQDASYCIYETDGTVGIKVRSKGKTYDLKGVKESKNGSLDALAQSSLKNVLIDNF